MEDPTDALGEGHRVKARRSLRATLAKVGLVGFGALSAVVLGGALGAGSWAWLGLLPLALVPAIKRGRRAAPEKTKVVPSAVEVPGPARLAERLELRTDVDALEAGSVVWPLVAAGALTPIVFGGVVAALVGLSIGAVSLGVYAVAHVIATASLTLGVGMIGEARRLIAPKERWFGRPSALRPIVLAAGATTMLLLVRPLSASLVLEVALAAGLFVLGSGALMLTPSLWWMRRRLRHERAVLARIALPAMTEDGPEALAWLKAAASSEAAPAGVRAEALTELVRRFPIADARESLEAALEGTGPELLTTALRLSLQFRHRPDLERLFVIAERFLGRSEVDRGQLDAAAVVVVCQLLRRYQDPRIEPMLLRLLDAPSIEVAGASAECLGLVGTIDAVEPLRRAAARGPVRVLAAEAIERIQIRHHKGQGGALSLADGEAGEVSLVDGGEGALSLKSVVPPGG